MQMTKRSYSKYLTHENVKMSTSRILRKKMFLYFAPFQSVNLFAFFVNLYQAKEDFYRSQTNLYDIFREQVWQYVMLSLTFFGRIQKVLYKFFRLVMSD